MSPTADACRRRAIRRRSHELRQRGAQARAASERLRGKSLFLASQSLRAITTLEDLGFPNAGRPPRLAALAIRVGRDPAIQLAKATIAQAEGITPREAFAAMRAASQERNTKLRDVARMVLAGQCVWCLAHQWGAPCTCADGDHPHLDPELALRAFQARPRLREPPAPLDGRRGKW